MEASAFALLWPTLMPSRQGNGEICGEQLWSLAYGSLSKTLLCQSSSICVAAGSMSAVV